MSLIRSRGNRATELRLVALMREHRITGWRRNAAVFGKPDFIFRRERVAVFVDGCFWHGCPKHATKPTTRAAWWAAKLGRNKDRDRLVGRTLRKQDWRVIRIWECDLKSKSSRRIATRIAEMLAEQRRTNSSYG